MGLVYMTLPLSSELPSSACLLPAESSVGLWPVLLTPYTQSNQVDHDAIASMVEFYLQRGVTGIFANCLSGEVFDLWPQERAAICRTLVRCTQGRLPVAAGGNFGSTLAEQARELQRTAEAGIDISVILLSVLPQAGDLIGQIEYLHDHTECLLGVYECPLPEHRLLSPQDLPRLTQLKRMVFMKETSRSASIFAEKLNYARNTQLRLYQANLRCLPAACAVGAHRTCGIIANICPELTLAYCRSGGRDSDAPYPIFNALIVAHDVMTSQCYPASAKYLLQKRGLSINDFTRFNGLGGLSEANRQVLDRLIDEFDWEQPVISDQHLRRLQTELGTPPIFD
jgi:4-hydroxy-tetrahydrodipicolinate synthase